MRHAPLAFLAAAAAATSGCPGGDPKNPPVLWLALDGVETEVKLIDEEPPPF